MRICLAIADPPASLKVTATLSPECTRSVMGMRPPAAVVFVPAPFARTLVLASIANERSLPPSAIVSDAAEID
jgi:hypothetical protein